MTQEQREMGQRNLSAAAERFLWAIQALALPPEQQKMLFPDFAEAPDELALDHEEAQEAFLEGSAGEELSTEQRDAMAVLDAQLERMSGPRNSHFWTPEALEAAAEWRQVRALANGVLAKMNWPAETPPQGRATYVGPPSQAT